MIQVYSIHRVGQVPRWVTIFRCRANGSWTSADKSAHRLTVGARSARILAKNWVESLPDGCPPPDAVPPQDGTYFRLVASVPPTEADFRSYRALFPSRKNPNDECVLRSCSVFTSYAACQEATNNRTQRGKRVMALALPGESGLIKQTGRNPTHFSWWRSAGFDPIAACREANASERES